MSEILQLEKYVIEQIIWQWCWKPRLWFKLTEYAVLCGVLPIIQNQS